MQSAPRRNPRPTRLRFGILELVRTSVTDAVPLVAVGAVAPVMPNPPGEPDAGASPGSGPDLGPPDTGVAFRALGGERVCAARSAAGRTRDSGAPAPTEIPPPPPSPAAAALPVAGVAARIATAV